MSFFILKYVASKPVRGINLRACESCTIHVPFSSFLQIDLRIAMSLGGGMVPSLVNQSAPTVRRRRCYGARSNARLGWSS